LMPRQPKDERVVLEEIKNLLIALLLKMGATSEELGAALRMHPGAVRKNFPVGKIRPSGGRK
jgi:glucuronate isomerase